MSSLGFKLKECKQCGKEFKQFRSTDKCCSYYCLKKWQHENGKIKQQKKKNLVKIRPVSERRLGELALYRERKKEYIKDNPKCERCGEKATDIHHKNGRNGERLNDKEFFMSACRKCHTWIHNNPQLSREQGWLI